MTSPTLARPDFGHPSGGDVSPDAERCPARALRVQQPFEPRKVRLVDEVVRPPVTRDGNEAVPEALELDRLLDDSIIGVRKYRSQHARPVPHRRLPDQESLSTDMFDRPVVAQPFDGVGRRPARHRGVRTTEHRTNEDVDQDGSTAGRVASYAMTISDDAGTADTPVRRLARRDAPPATAVTLGVHRSAT